MRFFNQTGGNATVRERVFSASDTLPNGRVSACIMRVFRVNNTLPDGRVSAFVCLIELLQDSAGIREIPAESVIFPRNLSFSRGICEIPAEFCNF